MPLVVKDGVLLPWDLQRLESFGQRSGVFDLDAAHVVKIAVAIEVIDNPIRRLADLFWDAADKGAEPLPLGGKPLRGVAGIALDGTDKNSRLVNFETDRR